MSNRPRQELAEIGSSDEMRGDDRLLTTLATGCHIENAAAAAGVSERTAYRRLADPEFRTKLDAAREALRESILAKLADAGHDAIGTLWELMHDGKEENIRLRAAKTLLDTLTSVHTILPKTKTTVRKLVETSESRES